MKLLLVAPKTNQTNLTRIPRWRARLRITATIPMTIALACILAACSSTFASATTSKTSSSGSQGVAKAKQFVSARSAKVTKIAIATPLRSKPKSGKTIVYLVTTNSSAENIGKNVTAAASSLGWKVKDIQTPPTPTAISSSMGLALSLNPAAIISGVGLPVTAFPTQFAELKQKGIPFVNIASTDPSQAGITTNIGTLADYAARGQWLANWVTATSNGNANVAVFNLSTYPALSATTSGFTKTLSTLCSRCKEAVQPVDAASIGTTLPSTIVDYLRSHPSVNYIVCTYGDMTIGLPAALKSAGLQDKVKVATQSGGVLNFQNVSDGSEAVNVPEDDGEIGWLAIDAVARKLGGDTLPQQSYSILQHMFVTKADVGTIQDPYSIFTAKPGYPSQFKTLWHVG
jgi:ribose transport system substrate-binding protein